MGGASQRANQQNTVLFCTLAVSRRRENVVNGKEVGAAPGTSNNTLTVIQEKYHLTATEAGWLAHRAGAKQVVPIHHSPIYHEKETLLWQELRQHFERGIAPHRA